MTTLYENFMQDNSGIYPVDFSDGDFDLYRRYMLQYYQHVIENYADLEVF